MRLMLHVNCVVYSRSLCFATKFHPLQCIRAICENYVKKKSRVHVFLFYPLTHRQPHWSNYYALSNTMRTSVESMLANKLYGVARQYSILAILARDCMLLQMILAFYSERRQRLASIRCWVWRMDAGGVIIKNGRRRACLRSGDSSSSSLAPAISVTAGVESSALSLVSADGAFVSCWN